MRSPILTLAVPLLLLRQAPIPLDDVAVRGVVEPSARRVTGTLRTAVAIPFGRLPVTGHAAVRYECGGTFAGTVDYPWLVRVLARLKRVDLVTAMEGSVATAVPRGCDPPHDAFAGHFQVRDTVITGYVRAGGDSVALGGSVSVAGDSAYHVVLSPANGAAGYEVRIHLLERRSAPAAPPPSATGE